MIQLINRRNALRTGLLASGGLAVLSQLGKAASPLTTSKEETNKAIVGRWFTDFWGKTCNLGIVDELAAPDMLLRYSLHKPRRGRADIKAFMFGFRQAFPNLDFWGAADLIAEGDIHDRSLSRENVLLPTRATEERANTITAEFSARDLCLSARALAFRRTRHPFAVSSHLCGLHRRLSLCPLPVSKQFGGSLGSLRSVAQSATCKTWQAAY
jgi:SnoaL-like polyketide cyclase